MPLDPNLAAAVARAEARLDARVEPERPKTEAQNVEDPGVTYLLTIRTKQVADPETGNLVPRRKVTLARGAVELKDIAQWFEPWLIMSSGMAGSSPPPIGPAMMAAVSQIAAMVEQMNEQSQQRAAVSGLPAPPRARRR